MKQISTFEHLADLILEKVLDEVVDLSSARHAIQQANPFGDHPRGRQIWMDALARNGVLHDKPLSAASSFRAYSTPDV